MDKLKEAIESSGEFETVEDFADAWDAALTETEKEDPRVSSSGSHTPSGVVVAQPKVTTRDVEPLVKGVGALICRAARVSDLTPKEATEIAEPAAHLLTILAPDMPPWAIPLGTLSSRIGAAVSQRSDEFKRNNTPRTRDDDDDEPEAVGTLTQEF